jgi:murein DD-endopeptidase MepM/ murein hydrolase activator NlpD
MDGSPRTVALAVEDGVRIEVVFGEQMSTQVVAPDPEIVTLAGEAVIDSSIFAALDEAGIPARFSVELAQMLGGTLDFRREMAGGEKLSLLWREARVGEDRIGQPELAFAALEISGSLYEIVWPDDGSGQATIYVDGEVLRVFAQPVEGARLSSVFGRRTHPVFGNVRMHTGVDFAAARGTPVQATAPGRVSFIGWRGGYGRVVEIAHGSDTMTRYAHLSAVPEGLLQGQRVAAGDVIGRVGATGTATGPNLHYEVLVDGRPTDPLSDDRLAEAAESEADDTAALSRLAEARALLNENLGSEIAETTTERL